MWANESVFYQIYPLGFCGAPFENDGVAVGRIKEVVLWKEHMIKLGVNAIYFSPLFESDTHGYNTRDYKKIDCRLGTNQEFKDVCDELHEANIKIVLDGVFHHVGRGFFGFQDVLQNREHSKYLHWFHIDLNGNSSYEDGLWYEGWEGHYDLVKLNLQNEEVIQYLLEVVSYWITYFDIDGIRLDVAYCLDHNFMRRLRSHCDEMKADFFLLGEMVHGDYNQLVNEEMLHSATNYETYKGLYSSFNSMNMFEIVHSLQRQFGPEEWCLYRGKHLLSFVDNHDVARISSALINENHLKPVYGMLFGMPGIPCIYYGSEWGVKGRKEDGDPNLRLRYETPLENELTEFIGAIAKIKRESHALNYGSFSSKFLVNKQCVIERASSEERVLVAVNAEEHSFWAQFDAGCGQVLNLLTGETITMNGGITLEPYEVLFLKCID
ncbi:MAG: alpha-amylase family glycosyl hydrolase [Eubacteriales bacterium]